MSFLECLYDFAMSSIVEEKDDFITLLRKIISRMFALASMFGLAAGYYGYRVSVADTKDVPALSALTALVFVFGFVMCLPFAVYVHVYRSTPDWIMAYAMVMAALITVSWDIITTFFPVRSTSIAIALMTISSRLEYGTMPIVGFLVVYYIVVEVRDSFGLPLRMPAAYDGSGVERFLFSFPGILAMTLIPAMVAGMVHEFTKLINSAKQSVFLAQDIAQLLIRYDTDGVRDFLELTKLPEADGGIEGVSLDLIQAFSQIASNLDIYRPHIPAYVLPQNDEDEDDENFSCASLSQRANDQRRRKMNKSNKSRGDGSRDNDTIHSDTESSRTDASDTGSRRTVDDTATFVSVSTPLNNTLAKSSSGGDAAKMLAASDNKLNHSGSGADLLARQNSSIKHDATNSSNKESGTSASKEDKGAKKRKGGLKLKAGEQQAGAGGAGRTTTLAPQKQPQQQQFLVGIHVERVVLCRINFKKFCSMVCRVAGGDLTALRGLAQVARQRQQMLKAAAAAQPSPTAAAGSCGNSVSFETSMRTQAAPVIAGGGGSLASVDGAVSATAGGGGGASTNSYPPPLLPLSPLSPLTPLASVYQTFLSAPSPTARSQLQQQQQQQQKTTIGDSKLDRAIALVAGLTDSDIAAIVKHRSSVVTARVNLLVEGLLDLAVSHDASIHSMIGDTIIVSWNAVNAFNLTMRASHNELKCCRFLMNLKATMKKALLTTVTDSASSSHAVRKLEKQLEALILIRRVSSGAGVGPAAAAGTSDSGSLSLNNSMSVAGAFNFSQGFEASGGSVLFSPMMMSSMPAVTSPLSTGSVAAATATRIVRKKKILQKASKTVAGSQEAGADGSGGGGGARIDMPGRVADDTAGFTTGASATGLSVIDNNFAAPSATSAGASSSSELLQQQGQVEQQQQQDEEEEEEEEEGEQEGTVSESESDTPPSSKSQQSMSSSHSKSSAQTARPLVPDSLLQQQQQQQQQMTTAGFGTSTIGMISPSTYSLASSGGGNVTSGGGVGDIMRKRTSGGVNTNDAKNSSKNKSDHNDDETSAEDFVSAAAAVGSAWCQIGGGTKRQAFMMTNFSHLDVLDGAASFAMNNDMVVVCRHIQSNVQHEFMLRGCTLLPPAGHESYLLTGSHGLLQQATEMHRRLVSNNNDSISSAGFVLLSGADARSPPAILLDSFQLGNGFKNNNNNNNNHSSRVNNNGANSVSGNQILSASGAGGGGAANRDTRASVVSLSGEEDTMMIGPRTGAAAAAATAAAGVTNSQRGADHSIFSTDTQRLAREIGGGSVSSTAQDVTAAALINLLQSFSSTSHSEAAAAAAAAMRDSGGNNNNNNNNPQQQQHLVMIGSPIYELVSKRKLQAGADSEWLYALDNTKEEENCEETKAATLLSTCVAHLARGQLDRGQRILSQLAANARMHDVRAFHTLNEVTVKIVRQLLGTQRSFQLQQQQQQRQSQHQQQRMMNISATSEGFFPGECSTHMEGTLTPPRNF